MNARVASLAGVDGSLRGILVLELCGDEPSGTFGTQMTPDYKPAVKALSDARISVFVLDVTSADYHSLEVGLQSVAAATGGTYASTFRLPNVATDRIARAISGWYVLTFDRGALEGMEPGRAHIKLKGRRGEVLARPVALR